MAEDPAKLAPILGEIGGVSSSWAARIAGVQELWAWIQRTRPYRAYSHFTDIGGSVLTSGMSYQALFAVFAALWLGFGLVGIFLRDNTELINSITEQINSYVPGLLGKDGLVSLDELLKTRVIDWTSVAAGVSLIWLAMNWFTGTRRSIRIIFGLEVKRYRNPVLLKLRDLMLALLFGLAILISAALTVFSTNLAEAILSFFGQKNPGWILSWVGTVLRFVVMYLVDVLVVIAIHRLLAEIRVPWRRLVFGCLLGGVALFVLKVLGAELLGGASTNPLLASFAVLIGILIWFNLICRVLLLTAAWVATGVHPGYGLPAKWVRAPAEQLSQLTYVSGDRVATVVSDVEADRAAREAEQPHQVRASISGRVSEWAVPYGAYIGSGDLIATVLAHPENGSTEESLRAPANGYARFEIATGKPVNAGDVIAMIERRPPRYSLKAYARQARAKLQERKAERRPAPDTAE